MTEAANRIQELEAALAEWKADFAALEDSQHRAVMQNEELRDALAQKTRECEELREDRDRDRRTMEVWEKSYLADHEHWGECKFKAQVEQLERQVAELSKLRT